MGKQIGTWTKQFLAMGVMFFSFATWAQGALQSEMQAFVVVTQADGTESFQEAASVEPGQVIEYRMSFRNTGDNPVSGLAVIGPVPAGTSYLENSAASRVEHAFEASIDGGTSWHVEPLLRTVMQPDGTEQQVIVPPEEYTHVRWMSPQPIASNASQEYRYRVYVLPVADNGQQEPAAGQ